MDQVMEAESGLIDEYDVPLHIQGSQVIVSTWVYQKLRTRVNGNSKNKQAKKQFCIVREDLAYIPWVQPTNSALLLIPYTSIV